MVTTGEQLPLPGTNPGEQFSGEQFSGEVFSGEQFSGEQLPYIHHVQVMGVPITCTWYMG